MQNRILGNDHLSVSAIGLGCWGMSHAYGPADEAESLATLNRCLDLGINFLDTADVYGDGHNEKLISRVLKHRRKETVIATKFGFIGDEHGNPAICGRPEHVRNACDSSLQRLGIDEIDLYYYHRLDPEVPVEETMGAMKDLVRQGKIRFIGLSEMSADTIRRAHTVHPVTALQSEYSLWHRDLEEHILPVCRKLSISLVPFSPLGRGFLTGTVSDRDTLSKTDYRRQMPRFKPEAMKKNQAVIKALKPMAKSIGATPSQVALAWLLARDETIVPIPGMKKRTYIEENLAAVNLKLPEEMIQGLNRLDINICGDRHNPLNLGFID